MGSEFKLTKANAPRARIGASAQREMVRKAAFNASRGRSNLSKPIRKGDLVLEDQVATVDQDWTAPGFGPLTRVTTNFGEVPAQTLRVRDQVRTHSGQFLPIVWLDRILLNEGFLRHHPEAMPIELHAGAFGPGCPARSVVLSPGQHVCPEPGFGAPQLLRVSKMLDRPGAFRKPEQIYTYTVFHLGAPALVHVEGLWVHLDPKVQNRSGS